VIDHHGRQPTLQAEFVDIRPDIGSCTTQLLGYQRLCEAPMNADLATAAAYAILSETQDLDRETTRSDREAFIRLFPLVRLRILGRIRHPARERVYYKTIARAMRRVMLSRNTCICHIGKIYAPEAVSEVADFLVAMERISWCLASGLYDGSMVLSIRTTDPDAQAQQVMKTILAQLGKGGGHGMIAGGALPCKDLDEYRKVADTLTGRFLNNLSRKGKENLHPLLGADEEDQ